MALVRLWQDGTSLKVIDPSDGMEQLIIIPGCADLDPHEREEIVLWQVERAEQEFAQRRANPKPQMTKREQHDLGDALAEIKASKTFYRENLHERYWRGAH